MSIILKKADKKSSDFKRIKLLYKTAFPLNERAPFAILSAKSKKNDVDFLSIYDDEKWVGLFYVLHYADLSYVFYFAISAEHRGKGYGSAALKAINEKYAGRRVFLAIEEVVETAKNYDERISRRNFYHRNGFEDLNRKLKEGNIIYELLGYNGTVEPDEYEKMIEKYLGKFLSKLVPMKII